MRNGDLNAFERLFKELNSSLCYYAFQLTKDQIFSQEIVNDVFLKLWQDRETINIRGSYKNYLYSMTHNHAINLLIKNNSLRNKVSKLISTDIWEKLESTVAINPFLLEKLEAEETNMIIEKAVSELPKQCRVVFSLSRYDYKSNREIASLLDISESSVRTYIFRSLEKIKKALEDYR